MNRPLASVQRGLSRMVTLDTGARVECIAESVDLMTGRPFLVIGGPIPFGVWPDELDWHSLTTDTQRADWCDSMQARGRAMDAFERSIDLLVSRLRQKLADDPDEPSMIKTVRGAGYMFNVQSVQGRMAWRV